MINDELLLNNGYKFYPDDIYGMLFQKRIKDENGLTKYHINIYRYDTTGRYEVKVQFEKSFYFVNMTLFGFEDDATLEVIEKEVEHIWSTLGYKREDDTDV